MVEIQCPHCDAVVGLEDGVSGTFSCLNCESSIEWGNTVNTTMRTPRGTIIFAILSILGLIAFISLVSSDGEHMGPEMLLTCCGICLIPFAIFVVFVIKEGK